MKAYNCPDIKSLTQALFVESSFDDFLVQEAKIVTYASFSIDGGTVKDYYTDEELQNSVEECCRWSKLRPLCFELIRGKKLPIRFRISLKAGKEILYNFLKKEDQDILPEEIGGAVISFRYESGTLNIISTASLKNFSMDRSAEKAWDRYTEEFLKELGVDTDEPQ